MDDVNSTEIQGNTLTRTLLTKKGEQHGKK